MNLDEAVSCLLAHHAADEGITAAGGRLLAIMGANPDMPWSPVLRTCPVCQNTFDIGLERNNRAHCSPACHSKAYRAMAKKRRSSHRPKMEGPTA